MADEVLSTGSGGPERHQVVVAYNTVATGTARSSAPPEYSIAHVTLTRRRKAWLVTGFEIHP